jgi:hypothetical protein
MAKLRNLSHESVGSDGPGAKEAQSSFFEAAGPTDSNLASSTAPVNPNAPFELNEVNSIQETAYAWSTKKKWAVLTVVALCQTSMSE